MPNAMPPVTPPVAPVVPPFPSTYWIRAPLRTPALMLSLPLGAWAPHAAYVNGVTAHDAHIHAQRPSERDRHMRASILGVRSPDGRRCPRPTPTVHLRHPCVSHRRLPVAK